MSCPAHGLAESRRMITPEDVDHIRELASRLPSKGIVVDLGTGSGTSLLMCWVMTQAKKYRSDG